MAKRKQKLNRTSATTHVESTQESSKPPVSPHPRIVGWCRSAANALLGALAVYVAYYPSDSVLVERGEAIWFVIGALGLFALTFGSEPMLRLGALERSDHGRTLSLRHLLGKHLAIDVLVWHLAAWMIVASLATCPPNNLRHATNEAWVWVAAAAVVTSARRLLAGSVSRSAMLTLLTCLTIGMSVETLHQQWISLPATRAAYKEDPQAVMRAAGIEAPEWSSKQMIFANRLFDGGPTAEFALANSLAAVLPVAVLVPLALLLWSRIAHANVWIASTLSALLIVAAMSLFATGSRSAIGACLMGIAWLCLGRSHSQSSLTRTLSRWLFAGVALGVCALLITIGFLLLGDEEWIATAPSSLEFRLRYWRAALALLFDHPVFGAGPGGFQSMYLRYRLPVASESISDPHNFFIETLTAGGWIAGGLLVSIGVTCLRVARTKREEPLNQTASNSANELLLGAAVGLGMIWLFALASGQLPDYRAAIFAVPIAVASGWLVHPLMTQLDPGKAKRAGAAILLVMLVHLCFAGGWTVPGVAMVVWILTAMLCDAGTVVNGKSSGSQISRVNRDLARRCSLAGLCVGAALLLCVRLVSLGPAQASKLAQQRAEGDLIRGFEKRADEESRRAVEADAWAFEASLWRSELLLSRFIQTGEPRQRDAWRNAAEEALRRAGDNPTVMRAIAEQGLHAYQRDGDAKDLSWADSLLTNAWQKNPVDVSLNAQLALTALEMGDLDRAIRLAERSETLSRAAGDVVQSLNLHHIYRVRHIGVGARQGSTLVRIDEEFARFLPEKAPVE